MSPLSTLPALIVALAGLPVAPSRAATDSMAQTVSACRVTDGDTIRCGGERIRLLGIDAPEMPGHCRRGRVCAADDPFRSARSLAAAMASSMRIERVGRDRYGRTLGLVFGPRGDLSCWQLSHRQAIYKPQWDNDGRVAQVCPKSAERAMRRDY